MANDLGLYDPLFYAQEGLMQLRSALGMANTVHRGHDKAPQTKGSTIKISRPGTFTAQNAPSSEQDLNPEEVSITLDQWKEVKFGLTDKELSYTTDEIIREHIEPAAYALADHIDTTLASQYVNVPWFHDVGATAGVSDLTATRKIMFDNKVPRANAARTHYVMADGDMEADFLSDAAFAQWQGSGEAGAQTQITGALGQRYGFNIFANQNVQSHTMGTASTASLAVNGTPAVGATTINLDAGTVTGTLVPGDTFVIAGNTQRYAVTNEVTAASNAFTGVTFTPALVAAPADNSAVTVSLDDHSAAMAYHRDAFALAMAPLPTIGNQLGAMVETVTDPITNLSIRSRMFYVGDSSKVMVALDVLYGVKTLNPNLAVRMRN